MLDKINISKIRNILFYIAFTIELFVALVEKSDLYNPYESYIFRITFLITLLVIAITPYNLKEWIVVIAMNIMGLYCYIHTGRNDLWRMIVFVCACKAIDLEKALRYMFYVTLIGCLIIVGLSVFGIYGNAFVSAVYRAGEEETVRYCFGFGHANGLQTMMFVLTALWLYIYKGTTKLKNLAMYIVLLLVNYLVYMLTDSRTSFATTILVIGLMAMNCFFPNALKGYAYSVISICLYVFSIVFSLWAAITANKTWTDTTLQYKVNSIINGRIMKLYFDSAKRRGWAGSWSLFSDDISTEYFDMGWVRLYYWYGIIPASIIIFIIFMILLYCLIKKESDLAILIASVAVYTIVEAHFVSDYIGRNYMLLIIGAFWSVSLLLAKGIGRYLLVIKSNKS